MTAEQIARNHGIAAERKRCAKILQGMVDAFQEKKLDDAKAQEIMDKVALVFTRVRELIEQGSVESE